LDKDRFNDYAVQADEAHLVRKWRLFLNR